MFWLRNKKISFLIRILNLSPDFIFFIKQEGERSGSVVEYLIETEGPRVRASPASLRCGP